MKTFLAAVAFTGALMCGAALAQNASPSPTAPNPQRPETQTTSQPTAIAASQAPRIAPGSVIPVELTKTVDAKKARTGDEVVARVTQDLKANSGELIVAKDTKMVGHVTESRAHTKEQKESEVGIAFDTAVTKSGEMKLPMSIQAIIAPPSNSADDSGGMAPGGPVTGGGTATSPMAGRPPLSAPTQPQPQSLPSGGGGPRPPINPSTQGVIGIPNLKLEANAQNAAQGSVVTSEKGNVKLESGTLLLLRVSQ
jgi:hypothetical protein